MHSSKTTIVDLWSYLHQPAKFNKVTYKRNGRKVTELQNSLLIHATKHPEIVNLGLQCNKDANNKQAYLLGINILLKYIYDGMRKNICEYELHSTEKRTRLSFMYYDNRVVIVLDHNRHNKYRREISAVTCYYKI